jgi:hypothetical protein
MAKLLYPEDYTDQDVSCEECGWIGKGREANLIDFYGVSEIQELHCPNCDATVATLNSSR